VLAFQALATRSTSLRGLTSRLDDLQAGMPSPSSSSSSTSGSVSRLLAAPLWSEPLARCSSSKLRARRAGHSTTSPSSRRRCSHSCLPLYYQDRTATYLPTPLHLASARCAFLGGIPGTLPEDLARRLGLTARCRFGRGARSRPMSGSSTWSAQRSSSGVKVWTLSRDAGSCATDWSAFGRAASVAISCASRSKLPSTRPARLLHTLHGALSSSSS